MPKYLHLSLILTLNTYNKLCVETACLCENCLVKSRLKVAQMVKFSQIWSLMTTFIGFQLGK